MSTEIKTKTIYEKLLDFQKLGIKLSKVGDNTYHNSKYVTLNEVLEKVTAPLNAMGILILQLPSKDGLNTVLYDTETNAQVECFMPYSDVSTAQKLGSCNTYNRRYSLITLLGLEDEDDDGNAASVAKKPVKSTVAQAPKYPDDLTKAESSPDDLPF